MAILTVDQIVQQIVNQLRLLDPTVSAEVGTPERKMIEANAELIASQQVDFTVLQNQQDINSMSGGRLDAYLSIFSFGRQQATPSYGTVTFSRNVSATNAITIPVGTQVIANIDDSVYPSLVFVTTDTVVLDANALSVDATVQCTVAGTIGNIDANKIVGFGGLKSIIGISTVSNKQAMSGGTDVESDTDYKARFQRTFLRNISGTTDMYLALAVSANSVTKANVVGPISRYQEYVQIPSSDDPAQQTSGGYDNGTSIGTFTVTIASPAVFTLTAHGLVAGDTVHFTTTGALPTGLAANTLYYVISAGLTANAFEVSATPGGSAINTSGTQSGTHTAYTTTFKHKRTTAESTIPYSKHTYTTNFYVTDGTLDPASANFFKPGVDYIFNTPPINASVAPTQSVDSSHPTQPNVTFLNPYGVANPAGNPDLVEGNVYLLEHAYMSVNSRNDTSYGILNCVDIFVNGEKDASASSVEVVPNSSHALQNTNALLWTYQKTTATKVINYRRKIDSSDAAVGNLVQPLYWQPVLDLPESIQVGAGTYWKANFYNPGDSTYYNLYDGVTYSRKAHYILVEEVNSNYGTIRARNGIEWFLSGNNHLGAQLPTDSDTSYSGVAIDTLTGTQFTVENYLYDQNISDLQAIMEKNKQTTTDVLVHRAKERYFRPMVTVMYTLGSTKAVVDASIIAALSSFFENQYYGAAIQLSDILQTIHNVPGVDNVRWTNPDTAGNKLEEVAADGSSLSGGPVYMTSDFYIQDNELAASPSANAVTITVRAQNTWGS